MITFSSAVDLSQHADVTQCNVVLPNEEDIYVRIYTTLGCSPGSIGKYVYIYKPTHGNVVLGEVVVLPKALLSRLSKIEGKFGIICVAINNISFEALFAFSRK